MSEEIEPFMKKRNGDDPGEDGGGSSAGQGTPNPTPQPQPPPQPLSSPANDPCASTRARYLQLTNDLRDLEGLPPLRQHTATPLMKGDGDGNGSGPPIDKAAIEAWHEENDTEYNRLAATLKGLNCQGPPTIGLIISSCQQELVPRLKQRLQDNMGKLRDTIETKFKEYNPSFKLDQNLFPSEGVDVRCVGNELHGGVWATLFADPLAPAFVGLNQLDDFLQNPPVSAVSGIAFRFSPELFAILGNLLRRSLPNRWNTNGNPDQNGTIEIKFISVTPQSPNQIVAGVTGTAQHVKVLGVDIGDIDFTITSTDTLTVDNGKLTNAPDVKLHADTDAIKAAIGFLIPLTQGAIGLANFVDQTVESKGEGLPRVSIGQLIVNLLSQKVPIEKPDPEEGMPPPQAMIFAVPFERITVDPINGLLAWDETLNFYRKRRPTMTLAGDFDISPASFNPQTGTAMGKYTIVPDELRDPLTVTWMVDGQGVSATGKSVTLTFTLDREELQQGFASRSISATVTDADQLQVTANAVVSIAVRGDDKPRGPRGKHLDNE